MKVNIISNFQASVSVSDAILNSISFVAVGTYEENDLSGKFRLLYNTIDDFNFEM
jgi:hypothetical protein